MHTGKPFPDKLLRRNPSIRFLRNLLGNIWLFFPSLLFIVLSIFCFTWLNQGKDILIAFTESKGSRSEALFTKCIFALAVLFWVYVNWYSSRIVAYIKAAKHREFATSLNPRLPETEYQSLFSQEIAFLKQFPRIIGYTCLIVLLFAFTFLLLGRRPAMLQLLIALAIAIFICWMIDRLLSRLTAPGMPANRLKWFLWAGALLIPSLAILLSLLDLFRIIPFTLLFLLVILGVFLLYSNLRRRRMREHENGVAASNAPLRKGWRLWISKIMQSLLLPQEESGYFLAFLFICLLGLSAYTLAIVSLPASALIGPFSIVLLAFTILLGFGNMVTALSCKYRINLHFFIFMAAAFLPTPDHHRVRTGSLADRRLPMTVYNNRQHLSEYLKHWLYARPEIDSVNDYPVYFVLANGGASRSAYWVASVLGKLEDASIASNGSRFSRQLFCLSGTSGGGVGLAAFYAQLLHRPGDPASGSFEKSGKAFLQQDFLSFTLARMLGPDFFNYIPLLNRIIPDADRADALEEAFEKSTDRYAPQIRFGDTWFDQCITQKGVPQDLPILLINTTRVKDGSPGVLSTIQLSSNIFNRRVDVTGLLQKGRTIRLSTAAILGARFPYISPAGRIDYASPPSQPGGTDTLRANYFVDGGYFDNSGAGAMQEMIRALLFIGDTSNDPVIKSRFRKISFRVLHITNSPQEPVSLQPIGPFVNDLFAPLLTILGAYDMQTTVNDRRFITFIHDLQTQTDTKNLLTASYTPIHLYNDPEIPGDSFSKGPYAMNWFISDSVRHQMDRRLETQPRLRVLIQTAFH